MTYPTHCDNAASRTPTHCGTFIDTHPYGPEPTALPSPDPAPQPEPAAELPRFGGPLFDDLLGNELVGF